MFRTQKSPIETVSRWLLTLDLLGSFRSMIFDTNDLLTVVHFQEGSRINDLAQFA